MTNIMSPSVRDYELEGVIYKEENIQNSRGMTLFTCSWLPANREQKALVFLCHGYGMESHISMKGTGRRLAKAGYGVYALDYEGHGKSSGLSGYIASFEDVVTDCSDHYTRISERREHVKRLRFLMGESMGGTVAILLHLKKPNFWAGAVLVAPMCKIEDDIRPSAFMVNVMTMLCRIIPTWGMIPSHDDIDTAYRDPTVRQEIRLNPYNYKGRPRLQTCSQLLTACLDLEQKLGEVSIPFLIVHGEEDEVRYSSVSNLLYESACSEDKTFKLYPGMWHSLIYGELPENIDAVFEDVNSWLDNRVSRRGDPCFQWPKLWSKASTSRAS